MKMITILRHAQAQEGTGEIADQARALTKRGLKDARRMGKVITRLKQPVDWILCSTSVRTRQTVQQMLDKHLGEVVNAKKQVSWDKRLYLADVATLLNIVQSAPEASEHLLLVGHNPGLGHLISGFCAGEPVRLNMHLAPGAFAHLRLDVFWWRQARWGSGRLQQMISPKVMKK